MARSFTMGMDVRSGGYALVCYQDGIAAGDLFTHPTAFSAHEAGQRWVADEPGSVMKAIDNGPNPDYEPMLQFFEYIHLPAHLQKFSKVFCDLACTIAKDFPKNPERTVALRKLLEAKDAGVRSTIYK